MTRTLFWISAVVMSLGVAQPAHGQLFGTSKNQARELRGTIVSLDHRTRVMQVRVSDGKIETVPIDPRVKITVDGEHATWEQLVAGQIVTLNRQGHGDKTVTAIAASGKPSGKSDATPAFTLPEPDVASPTGAQNTSTQPVGGISPADPSKAIGGFPSTGSSPSTGNANP